MKRYSEYKDSGIKWIGKIPSHWNVVPFGRCFSYGKGLPITKADLLSSGIAVISYGQIHSKTNTGTHINDDLVRYVNPVFLKTNPQCLLETNDFVFADTSEDLEGSGNCAFNDYSEPIFAGYHTLIARPFNLIYPKYYAYLFRSNNWKHQVQTLVNGVKVYSISRGVLKKSNILIPSEKEQYAIVSYLDSKVSKIDEYIAASERKIAALDELKQTIIADAVIRGINPNAKMKDSGIKWIGDVPEHWEISKIRSLFKLNNEKTEEPDGTLLSLSQYTGVKLKKDCEKAGMFEAENTIGYNIVHKGQFVMNIMLAWNGSYAVSNYDGVISPAYCIFDFIRPCNKMYFDYLLRIKAYSGAFKTLSKGLIDSRLRLYPDYFKTFPIIIPPIEEQNNIVSYIKQKVSEIDHLKAAEQSQIDKLKEYKQRLISDVVTGKVKVTND